jgi:PD-(D/E)XK nuclease superfamily
MTIDLTRALATPPPIPDKMEVIPIHASDRGAFKRCRRRWDWSSPSRNNLVPKASVMGVSVPLWFGTGIHYALEHYYNPTLQRDPVESFRYWFDLTWRGGTITKEELKLSYDYGVLLNDGTYRVNGLQDILPDPDQEEFLMHKELGEKMMEFYKLYAQANDNFAVIMVEHDFSIPLGFDALDPRDGEIKQVHARGRMDTVIQDLETGRFGLIDHKSAIKIDEAYFEKLNKDDQITTYLWAAEREAEIHDLPYKNMDYLIYQAIRKAYPKPPSVTSRGFPSLDRTKESTTSGMFKQACETLGLTSWLSSNEKAKGYYEWLQEVGDSQFIVRTTVPRNKFEKEACGRHIEMEARDMLNEPAIYPNPTGDWYCVRCSFRPPCLAKDDGSDFQSLLDNNYEPNKDR